jgi:hypothetical protein
MSKKDDRRPTLSPEGRGAAEESRRRLAAALRHNLQKRKAQQRARADALATRTADGSAGGDGKE